MVRPAISLPLPMCLCGCEYACVYMRVCQLALSVPGSAVRCSAALLIAESLNGSRILTVTTDTGAGHEAVLLSLQAKPPL